MVSLYVGSAVFFRSIGSFHRTRFAGEFLKHSFETGLDSLQLLDAMDRCDTTVGQNGFCTLDHRWDGAFPYQAAQSANLGFALRHRLLLETAGLPCSLQVDVAFDQGREIDASGPSDGSCAPEA